jgi:hypothetical protein
MVTQSPPQINKKEKKKRRRKSLEGYQEER